MMRIAFLLFITAFLFACTSQRTVTTASQPQKTVEPVKILEQEYLHKRTDTGKLSIDIPDVVIQKNDLLHIRVFSQSIIPETDLPYNLPESGGSASGSSAPTSGFLVDRNGNIEYPQIGTLHVEGLTKEEVASLIKTRLKGSLNNPSVIVRLINYKITVLGEVKNPMTFTAPTEQINILEALGMAGDVTELADKSSITVTRHNNGKVDIGKVDLTSTDFFNSPFFWLRQNDVVIVEGSERKIRAEERELRQDAREIRQDAREIKQEAKELQIEERQAVAQQIGIITGIITSIALILNLIK